MTERPPIVTPRYPDVDILPSGKWVTGETIIVDDGGETWLIPKGTETNFASLPRIARLVWRTWGQHSIPTIVHDDEYAEKRHSKAYVDKLFLRMMEDYGVDWLTRRLFYLGVRANFVSAWRW